MLRRRFKPEKCKIALKLAIPRIKVMRNKKEAQFKQSKRELAQLLESGQDQTARIRVEHVVREEKTMVAYDLLEIYCELIVARMPSIESQKNCPIDLKEAISSVIFASARCEEIPELKDVTKHLTTKYGKDFTTSALELHPDSGVGRMLVDKLSVKAPDGPTKLKILTAIAEEHNIKWDPESFGAKESKVYDNLMNGPSTLPEATKMSAGPHNTQASTSYYVQRPPSVQDPKHIAKSDVPSSFYEHKSRLSPHPKNFDYSNTSANNSISSGAYHPRSKPQQTENQGTEFRNSSYRNESASPREHGNMEFKDATAAAQVAAESAERASMAARATAELSSHGNIAPQYSMESNISGHGMRDEEPRKYIGSASQYEYFARHPVDTSFHERNSTKYEQTDSNKQHNRTGETENGFTNFVKNDGKSTHCSSKSTADSFNEKPSVINQIPDAYSQINSSVGREMEHFSEVTMERNSGNEMQFVNELHGIKNPQNVDDHEVRDCEQSSYSSHSRSNTSINDCDVASNLDWQKSENDNRNSGEKMQFVNELHDRKNYDVTDYQEERIGNQLSFSSSSSSSTFNDDVDVVSNFNHQKLGNFSVENSVLLNDKGSLQRNTIETTYTYYNASAVFDDYGSYNDEGTFDFEEEHKVHEDNMNLSYPFQRSPAHPCPCTNSLGFKQKVESQKEPYSQSHIFSEQRSTPVFFESSTSSAVPSHGNDLPPTFDKYGPSSESEDEVDKSDRNNNPSIGSQKRNMDSHQAENSVFNQRLAGGMEDTELSNDSSTESKELNFGKLIGGLRNKGYRHPPYLKIPQGIALSSGEAENDTFARIKQTSPPLAVEDSVSTRFYNQEWCSRKGSGEASQKLNKRISVTCADSSDDDFEEERPKQTFSSTRDLYNILPSSEENKRSTSRVPMAYFDSGNSDSDEDLPKTGSKTHSSTGFSHKTMDSPSNSRRGSTLKTTVSFEPAVVSDYGGEKNSSSRSCSADEALLELQSHKRNSDNRESFQNSQLAPETKMNSSDGSSKSSENEQPSTSVPVIVSSGSAESSKAQNSTEGRPSYVHPKLPDYDTLAAHLNSLRQNHQ
ncbi:hypothetical protein E1A91_D06G083100v1 [Gossypium mustelinum]|uniref:IST1-like protein n=1 Tax=Gossypium mustelinum TaxID=34275 RepID=A0A5D2UJ29_GOSMU|nr:hypothetical protein E1A91_D06G083100v1 [Gossypium mustelinum]